MITLDYDQLLALLAQFVYPLARIMALIAVAPPFGHTAVPPRVKLGLGAAITGLLFPLVPSPPPLDPFTGEGMVLLGREILIGWILGFTVRLVFAAVDLAGEVMALHMGLGFASFFDPMHGGTSASLAQVLGYLTMLVWLAVGGPLLLIAALGSTFESMPVATATLPAIELQTLLTAASLMFAAALQMALPVIVALTIVNVALGVLSRAAPQMNLISVGFPVTVLVGMLAFGAALPFVLQLVERNLLSAVELVFR